VYTINIYQQWNKFQCVVKCPTPESCYVYCDYLNLHEEETQLVQITMGTQDTYIHVRMFSFAFQLLLRFPPFKLKWLRFVSLKPEQSVLTDLFLITLRGTFRGMRNSITLQFITCICIWTHNIPSHNILKHNAQVTNTFKCLTSYNYSAKNILVL
jgi:hypothetical protein